MHLYNYKVGQVIPRLKNYMDGVTVDITDNGINVIVLCNKSTKYEIQQFKASSKVQVKVINKAGVIFFLMKFGNLPWMDAPYNVHASLAAGTLSKLPSYIHDKTKGYAINLMVIDTSTGKIKNLRLFALDHNESNKLCRYVSDQAADSSIRFCFDTVLDMIYARLSTEDLLDFWEEIESHN